MNCKYCNSSSIIKFGTHTDVNGIEIQRYYCKDCERKFVPNTLPKMQTPMNQVSSALRMYYSGMSLDGIQGQLKQDFGNKVAESTIWYWITRFTKHAIDRVKNFNPKVGDVWIADETGIDVHGHHRDMWFWDIIDTKSRYLLASHISTSRTSEDAQALIRKAVLRAGKVPKVIITDKLRVYIDGIDFSVGLYKVQHIRSKPFTDKNSTNIIERFHGTFKDRTKVIRAFKSLDTARLLTDGWLIHYNFFKEHESLGNVPPAIKMNLPLPFKNWTDVVINSKLKESTPVSSINFFSKVGMPKTLTPEQIKRQNRRIIVKRAVNKYLDKKKEQKTIPSIKRIGK